MGEFTQTEHELIDDVARRKQADIDLARVSEIVASPEFSPYDIPQEMLVNPGIRRQMTPEIWAAVAVRMTRDVNSEIEDGDADRARWLMAMMEMAGYGMQACIGLQLIKDVNEFVRFQPTIESIFELDDSQLKKARTYLEKFRESPYKYAIEAEKEPLINGFQQWDETDLSTENINHGREIYESCMKIFERGFPNLLALKRVMDGETPEVEVLQKKSASSVRRELTEDNLMSNSEDNPMSNSVYFDLIVERFDTELRNGIAHNDLVRDPIESKVHIPSRNISYGYEEFNDIVRENFAAGVFLTGTFRSLVKWHAGTNGMEHRSKRPEWVFGERSVPEGMSGWIEEKFEESADSD